MTKPREDIQRLYDPFNLSVESEEERVTSSISGSPRKNRTETRPNDLPVVPGFTLVRRMEKIISKRQRYEMTHDVKIGSLDLKNVSVRTDTYQ